MKNKFNATVETSRWETERTSGGVGVGGTVVELDIFGDSFSIPINRDKKYVKPEKWQRHGSGYRDNWTGATVGVYRQQVVLEKSDVVELLKDVVEWEGDPLNFHRFTNSQGYWKRIQAAKHLAELLGKPLPIFVKGYLFPLPHPEYGCDEEYVKAREEIFRNFQIS